MPGWHEKTKELQKAGKLAVAGIAEEQHGDRTRLFMQWKQMDWPVMIDPLNLLEVKAVPITLLIDEHGVIRHKNPKSSDLESFLATKFEPGAETPSGEANLSAERRAIAKIVATNDHAKLGKALERLPKESPRDAFWRGVLHRMRHDSAHRKPGDFTAAVGAWEKALDGVPSQYIWRRRIQQYGPRLDKPYPFYDWVTGAREAITGRGEKPPPLVAEPSGAEIAKPGKNLPKGERKHPDPKAEVPEDTRGLIDVQVTPVASTKEGARAYRIHLAMTPNAKLSGHWNNESDPPALWMDDAKGWTIGEPRLTNFAAPSTPTSDELRTIEFEARASGDGVALTGAVYYYVCEGKTGTCLFLRQPLRIELGGR